MMKELLVFYTGSWSTTLEVPDNFVFSRDNIIDLIADNEQDFDVSDGGADWTLENVQLDDLKLDLES
jgi:hypothetical protein